MFSEDSSLKAALSLAMLSSETGFAHVEVERSQYLKCQHDDKHRREWEIKVLTLYFNPFSFDACCWCHCGWKHYISGAEPLAGDSELVDLRNKVMLFSVLIVKRYFCFTNGIQCELVGGFSVHGRIWQLSKGLQLSLLQNWFPGL